MWAWEIGDGPATGRMRLAERPGPVPGRGAAVVVNNVGLPELDRCLEACASGGG